MTLLALESRRRTGKIETQRSSWAAFGEATADPVIGRLVLLTFLVGFALTGTKSIFGLWTQARDGWGPRQIGACFACAGLAAAGTQLGFTRRLTKRFGEGRMLTGGMLLTVICSGLPPFSPSGLTTVALLSVTAIGHSVAFPNVGAMISRAADPLRRGQILGLNNACAAPARITGPFRAGVAFTELGRDLPFSSWRRAWSRRPSCWRAQQHAALPLHALPPHDPRVGQGRISVPHTAAPSSAARLMRHKMVASLKAIFSAPPNARCTSRLWPT